MLLTFIARDVKTEEIHQLPTAKRDTSYEGWEIDAWARCVRTYCLPSTFTPIEWHEGHPEDDENNNYRFRDEVQQNVEPQETDDD